MAHTARAKHATRIGNTHTNGVMTAASVKVRLVRLALIHVRFASSITPSHISNGTIAGASTEAVSMEATRVEAWLVGTA